MSVKATRTKKDVVTEFRCQTILHAARSVFARKGFSAALVDDIADEAGIAKGTLYLYFRSKEDIYLAALNDELQRFHEQTLKALDSAEGAREKLRAFVTVALENCRTNADFLRIYVSEFHKPKTLFPFHQQRLSLLTSIVEEGLKTGEIKPIDSQGVVLALFDIIRGLLERQVMGQSGNSPEQDLELSLDLIWNGLTPKP